MQENLIKLHSIILDGDLTEAAKLCDELLAEHQRGVDMDQDKQHYALRLAEWIEEDMSCQGDAEIAAELRRLHARVQELEAEKARLIETYVPCPSATETYMYGIKQEKHG